MGEPRAQRPSDMMLLNQVSTQVRTVKRHRRNTSNPWDYNETTISVVANVADYAILAADFGSALSVISYDPTNPSWVPRLIPIVQPQNMEFDWGLQRNAGQYYVAYDGSNCTALRCAFYWRDNQAYIRFAPLPQLSCQYQIKYLQSANGVNTAALTDSPVSNEDADIVEVRAALSLLPLTEWQMPDTAEHRGYNAERRRDLAQGLSAEERELSRQFEAAMLQPQGNRLSTRWDPCDG